MDQHGAGRRLCWVCPGGPEVSESTDFGRLIREVRLNSGMSQRELGERIGTTQSAIARLESGDAQPKIGTLQKLAEAFDRDLHLYVRAEESI
jgi:transcriptional regulator with XRE-family HTH domain